MKAIWIFTFVLLFVSPVSSKAGLYSLISSCQNCNNVSYSATLKYQGTETHYINTTNQIVPYLNFTYCFKASHHSVIRLTDANKTRWEVPKTYPFPYNDDFQPCISLPQAQATINVTSSPFSFSVTRTLTKEVIFDSNAGDLIYSDYYLEFTTFLPSKNLYGFGERAYKLDLGTGGTFTLWNKDAMDLENVTPGHNVYGYHTVYLQREKSNNFSTVLLRSSNAMDVTITNPVLRCKSTLTYKVIGGILEFNIFTGDGKINSPESVVKQYHSFLGGWALHPFWAMGHHQCRWGYKNIQDLTQVLANYSLHNLPLDVIWSDIDYMSDYVDFTINTTAFRPNIKSAGSLSSMQALLSTTIPSTISP